MYFFFNFVDEASAHTSVSPVSHQISFALNSSKFHPLREENKERLRNIRLLLPACQCHQVKGSLSGNQKQMLLYNTIFTHNLFDDSYYVECRFIDKGAFPVTEGIHSYISKKVETKFYLNKDSKGFLTSYYTKSTSLH